MAVLVIVNVRPFSGRKRLIFKLDTLKKPEVPATGDGVGDNGMLTMVCMAGAAGLGDSHHLEPRGKRFSARHGNSRAELRRVLATPWTSLCTDARLSPKLCRNSTFGGHGEEHPKQIDKTIDLLLIRMQPPLPLHQRLNLSRLHYETCTAAAVIR